MLRRALPAIALVFPLVAQAAAPTSIPVTGYLVDADGAPVNDQITVDLALYTESTAGTAIWEETQTIDVDNGQFTVYLGDTTPVDLAVFRDNGTVFLGLAVDSGAEMTPRFTVATAPFAGYAQYCDDAATVGGIDPADFRLTADKVAWADLDPATLPTGLDDGDADTTYTAGEGLALSSTGQFTADKAIVEGWAKGVAYDTLSELQAVLDTVYAAKMTCTANQVLMANGSGAWTCTDSTALPLSEAAVDAAVANNGFALAADLTALAARVTTAEGSITTLTTGLAANGAVDATQTTNITALTTGLTANTAIDTTQTGNITTLTSGLAANTAIDTTQTGNITTLTTGLAALATPGTLNASTNPVDYTKLKNVPADSSGPSWAVAFSDTLLNGTGGWGMAAGGGPAVTAFNCAGTRILGPNFASGIVCGTNANATLTKTYVLPAHTKVRVSYNYHYLDSWDGESAFFAHTLIGNRVWTSPAANANFPGTNVCANGWTDALNVPAEVEFAHTGNLVVFFGSTLDQGCNDEAYGISNIQISVQ